jgi:hypothetical protein
MFASKWIRARAALRQGGTQMRHCAQAMGKIGGKKIRCDTKTPFLSQNLLSPSISRHATSSSLPGAPTRQRRAWGREVLGRCQRIGPPSIRALASGLETASESERVPLSVRKTEGSGLQMRPLDRWSMLSLDGSSLRVGGRGLRSCDHDLRARGSGPRVCRSHIGSVIRAFDSAPPHFKAADPGFGTALPSTDS